MKGIREPSLLPSIDTWKPDVFANYSGSDRKDGLISPDGERYLIKFAEDHARKNDMDTSYVNNVLAEYISSHILRIIGYDVHDTFIATRYEELVVVCKNFETDGTILIELGKYLRKHYDSGDIGRIPELGQIQYIFENDITLKPFADELMTSYAERFIGDALTGNFDRHMGNVGYLVTRSGHVKPSPVYDNGSTLFPALSEKAMKEVLSSKKEIAKRVMLFPKAALTVKKEKVSYYDMLTSGYCTEISRAVIKMVPKIKEKLPEIEQFIEEQMFISDTRRFFYKTIIQARMTLLLEPALKICQTGKYDKSAYDRISQGRKYTEELFETWYDQQEMKMEVCYVET